MKDLVVWPEESDFPVAQHPELQTLFNSLGARIDLTPLAARYFEDSARAGRGDLYVFEFGESSTTVVALDTYSEPTDQLDLVSLYVRCIQEKSSEISLIIHRLFNSASVQVHIAQKSISNALREAIDLRNFPRSFQGSSFMQSQIRDRAA